MQNANNFSITFHDIEGKNNAVCTHFKIQMELQEWCQNSGKILFNVLM